MKYMTVKVDAELVRAMKIMAAQQGTTVTALVRDAVQKMIKERAKR